MPSKDINPLVCCFAYCCVTPVVAGTGTAFVSGIVAFNTWLGGVILKSAGWAPAAISHLPYVGAVGAATIAGPILCCVTYCEVTKALSDSPSSVSESAQNAAGNSLGGTAIGGAIYASTGAAIIHWEGAKLGFAAASGAIGGAVGTAALVAGTAITVLGGIACCGSIMVCCKAFLNGQEREFYVRSSTRPGQDLTADSLRADLRQNGVLSTDEIIQALTRNGLTREANTFVEAHNSLINGKGASAPSYDGIYVPQMK